MTAAVDAPARTERALARVPVHPALLAAWPVLRLYGDNANEFALVEILLPISIAIGLALAALVLLTMIWREPRRAAIVASALVVPFLTFGLVATTVAPVWPHEPLVRAYLLTLAVWVGSSSSRSTWRPSSVDGWARRRRH